MEVVDELDTVVKVELADVVVDVTIDELEVVVDEIVVVDDAVDVDYDMRLGDDQHTYDTTY